MAIKREFTFQFFLQINYEKIFFSFLLIYYRQIACLFFAACLRLSSLLRLSLHLFPGFRVLLPSGDCSQANLTFLPSPILLMCSSHSYFLLKTHSLTFSILHIRLILSLSSLSSSAFPVISRKTFIYLDTRSLSDFVVFDRAVLSVLVGHYGPNGGFVYS